MRKNSFGRLLNHYREMFGIFDGVHFNSTLTQSVFDAHVHTNHGSPISITHGDVTDNRTAREYNDDCLYMVFIGHRTIYKGYPLLEEVLLELEQEGYCNWRLDAWGSTGDSNNDKIHYRGSFAHSELGSVFAQDAVLMAPSVWNETFSLVALEALSFGTPTLVSSTVGAKDVVKEYDAWFIFTDKQDLKNKLRTLMEDKAKLKAFNNQICTQEWRHSMAQHALEIEEFYRSL